MAEDQNLKDAQYRKSLSISFFNAVNNATEMAKIALAVSEQMNPEKLRAFITSTRDWLLEQHAEYYSKTIANVGVAYRAADTIKELKKAKTMDELKKRWLDLSQDERRDGEIIKAVEELKIALAKKPAKVEAPKAPVVKKATKPNETARRHTTGKPRVAPEKKG